MSSTSDGRSVGRRRRPENASSVERISRKEIENGEQKIERRYQKQYTRQSVNAGGTHDCHQKDKENGKQKTGGRAGDGYSKFSPWRFGFMPHPRQAAKRMENYLDDLDTLQAGDERMRQLVNEHTGEKDDCCKKAK